MAKPSARLISAAAALALLAGCKMNVTSELYTSDIRHVAVSGATDVTTPGTLAIEIPSADKCQEYAERLSRIVGTSVIGFVPKGCERAGMNTFLMASMEIPIVADEHSWRQANSLFATMAYVFDEGEYIIAVLLLDAAEFKSLNDRLSKEFHQRLDLSGSKVAIVLNNDERRDIEIWMNDVFYDGHPIHGFDRAQAVLSHRQAAEFVLSNVSIAWMEQEGWAALFLLEHPPS